VQAAWRRDQTCPGSGWRTTSRAGLRPPKVGPRGGSQRLRARYLYRGAIIANAPPTWRSWKLAEVESGDVRALFLRHGGRRRDRRLEPDPRSPTSKSGARGLTREELRKWMRLGRAAGRIAGLPGLGRPRRELPGLALAALVHPRFGFGFRPGAVAAVPAAGEAGGCPHRGLLASHRPVFDQVGGHERMFPSGSTDDPSRPRVSAGSQGRVALLLPEVQDGEVPYPKEQ
jgi:hypothetical protein